MTDAPTLDAGLLVLRSLLAVVLFCHATQKLAGWFSGGGIDAAGAGFERMGLRPGRPLAAVAGVSELAAGTLLAAGALFPLATAIGLGTMLVAGAVLTRSKRTIWNAQGGGEYPLLLASVMAALAFTGPGRWSLDHGLSVPWADPTSVPAGVVPAAVITVALVATAPVLIRQAAPATDDERR